MVRRRKSELVPRAGGRSRHAPRTAPPATAQSPGPSTPGFPASAKRGAKEGAKGRNVSTEQMKGRLAIKAATMNLSGQSVMGLTPAYKLNYIREYLESLPDVVFIQDGIREEDVTKILEEVSDGKYSCEFQALPRREGHDREDQEEREDKVRSPGPAPPLTAVVWNGEKYHGTPLELGDARLGELAAWLQLHNITVVKLDCRTRVGFQDVYPSFIAMSWHGRDYDTTLRDRTGDVGEFLQFVGTLRSNNLGIPILVGGDFNMDMKSYDMEQYKDLSIVPYRPLSGKNVMRDLRNTFLFTMDALQITETHYKQFHPDIFHSPWVSIQVKGRTKLHLWAVVKIQRAFRKYRGRKEARQEAKQKVSSTKERWRKNAEGDQYKPPPPPPDPPRRRQQPRQQQVALSPGGPSKEEEEAELRRRRRTDFMEDVSEESDYVKHFYDNQRNPNGAVGAVFRRKRFDDLKSVSQRKEESKQVEQQIESWLNR